MPLTKKTFRLFVSSTFDDFKIERNALQEEVFPKLRDLCMERGFRFQAIDLRWGISDEAGRDHKTIQICLDEIKRCQETKLKPNFIVLLGNRYGYRPLPLQIDAEEFENILSKVSLKDKELICWSNGQTDMKKGWYRKDKNAEPPKYFLRARDIPEHTPGKEKHEALEKEAAEWKEIETRMRNIILNAIERLGWKKNDLRRIKYEASVMHREIKEGILKVKNAAESAFAFFRTIRNIQHNQSSNNYIEQDINAVKRLNYIKKELKKNLSECLSYEVEWVGDGIKNESISPVRIKSKNDLTNDPVKRGISKLCQDVYDNVSKIIRQEIDRFEERTLEVEIERHESFGNKRAEFFTGREKQLKEIVNCLDSRKCRLLAVYGKPGSGKSALVARSSQLAHEKYPNTHIITRYIGITPESVNIESLIESLCREIKITYGKETIYDTTTLKSMKPLKELIKEFIKCLELATEKEPLFIFLDAIDQLLETENAFYKGLLPTRIPEYVHFVISTSDKSQLASEILKTQSPHSNLIELSPMSRQEGSVLLDKWLKNAGRKLQDEQCNEVLDKFEHEGLPLFLMIIFGEARLWHSYDRVGTLGSNIDSVLNDLLLRLSHPSYHGELIVSRSMGYLAAAKNGLTEDEILDILSNDVEIYEDFIKTMFHVPVDLLSCAKKHLNKEVNDTKLEAWLMDIRNDHQQLKDFLSLVFKEKKRPHLPMILWIRLYHDLEPYLTERADNGTSLLNFYHPVIGETISTLVGKRKRHRDLADYFVNLQNWVDKEKRTKPNIRKMAELPYQQTCAQMWKELEKTLCDLDFVEAKCSAGMTYDLVSDYNRLGVGRTQPGLPFQTAWLWKGNFRVQCIFCLTWNSVQKGELGQIVRCPGCNGEMKLNEFVTEGEWHSSNLQKKVKKIVSKKQPEFPQSMLEFSDFVCSQAHLLSEYPQITFQQAANCPDTTSPAQAAKISQKLGDESFSWFEIVNKSQQIGQDIMTLRGHNDDVVRCGFSPDGELIVSASRDNTLRIWESRTGRESSVLEGHSKDVVDFVYLPMVKRIVSASWDGTLRLWNPFTGELLNTLADHSKEVFTVVYSPEGKLIASGSLDNTVRLWNVQTGKNVGVLYSHNKGVVCCCFSPQGDRVVSGSWDNTLKLWKVIAGEETKELATLDKHKDRVRACDFSPDGTMLVSASADKTLILWDAHTGKKLKILEGHSGKVNVCTFSPNGKYIASVADDYIVRLWPIHSHSKNSINLGKGNPNTVSFSPDGKYISDGFKVWLVDNIGEVIQLAGHHGHVKDCAWSPDGRRLVSASRDGTLIVWDVYFQSNFRKIKRRQNVRLHFKKWIRKKQGTVENPLRTIWRQKYLGFLGSTSKITIERISDRFMPDVPGKGEWCKDEESIVYATEGAVLVMDTFLSGQIAAFPWYLENRHLCSCSPDGKRYVKPCREGLFDLQTGTEVCHLPALWPLPGESGGQIPGKENELITFSPDSTRLARYIINANYEKFPVFVMTTSDKKSEYDKLNNWNDAVLLWNVQTGNELGMVRKGLERLLLYVLDEEKKIKKLKQWGRISTLEFSPDGQYLLTAKEGDTECELRVWNLQTNEDAHKLSVRGRTITTCAFSPDCQHFVSAHEDNNTTRNKYYFLKIWQIFKGIEERYIYINHNASPRRCEYSADGKHIVVSFRDGTLKIWDTDTDEAPRSFRPHSNQSIIFVVSKDVRYILTSGCGPDNQPEIKLWDFKTLNLLGITTMSESPNALALRPTGLLVTIGEKNKTTFFRVHSPFEFPIVTPVILYCPELGRFASQKTVRCEWCGFRFVAPPHILKTILKLKAGSKRSDKTDSLQSPCPNKQERDKSQLIYNCPQCNKIVRFNPFYFYNERIDK